MLASDFAATRVNIERALESLRGTDEISTYIRDALDLLLEAVIVAEHRRAPAQVFEFPRRGWNRPVSGCGRRA